METARQIYQKIQEGSLELNAADSGVQTRAQVSLFFLNFIIINFYTLKLQKSNQIAADAPEAKQDDKNCSC